MGSKNFMSNILDELMGRNRDALPNDAPKQIQWDDPEICPYYLVCFCPHELFVNTKADLGACSKFHDDQLRKKYLEEAPGYKRTQFEKEFIRFAEKMISDIEGKIKRGRIRIALANGPDGGTYAGPGSKNAEKIALLTERINKLLEEAEAAGCEGDVEKAQGILKLCDQIKEEREQLKSNEVSHPWNPDKAMQVCEVCGSYLIIGEAQHRLDDHIMGKQHMGFAMLRKTLDDVRKSVEKREIDERLQMEREREQRANNRRDRLDIDRDRRREDRDGDNSRRDRDRDSHRRDRDRDRSDRDRKRHRSRSTDKDRKDRRSDRSREKDKSRDRSRRNSSRDRRYHSDDKKRSRRSRSGSRKDRKRSRSRDHDRSKEKDRKHHHRVKEDDEKERKRERENGTSKDDTSPLRPPPEKVQKSESVEQDEDDFYSPMKQKIQYPEEERGEDDVSPTCSKAFSD